MPKKGKATLCAELSEAALLRKAAELRSASPAPSFAPRSCVKEAGGGNNMGRPGRKLPLGPKVKMSEKNRILRILLFGARLLCGI